MTPRRPTGESRRRGRSSRRRSAAIAALTSLALLAAAFASAASAAQPASAGSLPEGVVVCNEAQSSWRGTWDATASTDPLPPARHKDAAMPVGRGGGLIRAAANSPALAVCVAAPGDGDDGGDWGGGQPPT